ncbi:glycosyltransferase [soil metagenome]
MRIALEDAGAGAAAAETAVVFACDADYAPFAAFAAAQIARLSPGRGFDIVIASMEGLALPASLGWAGIRTCRIETAGAFAGLNLDRRRTESAYLRLALPQALAGDYRRLLYLDADVYVQGGDIAGLSSLDIGGRPLAAVRDNSQWRTPGRRPEQFRRLGLPGARYFNSGVMLIDVPAWRAARLTERCLDFAAEHQGRMIGHDQNLINCVLQGGWAELGPVWNWQYTWASRFFEAMVGANIVHFIGPRKPWRHTGGELPLKFRRAYRAFLAEHYPGLEPIAGDGVLPQANRWFLRKSLAKHLIATGPMCAYLDRFDGELAVVL